MKRKIRCFQVVEAYFHDKLFSESKSQNKERKRKPIWIITVVALKYCKTYKDKLFFVTIYGQACLTAACLLLLTDKDPDLQLIGCLIINYVVATPFSGRVLYKDDAKQQAMSIFRFLMKQIGFHCVSFGKLELMRAISISKSTLSELFHWILELIYARWNTSLCLTEFLVASAFIGSVPFDMFFTLSS